MDLTNHSFWCTDLKLEFYRELKRLEIGEAKTFKIQPNLIKKIIIEAKQFAQSKELNIDWSSTKDGVITITRLEFEEKLDHTPIIILDPGQSLTFDNVTAKQGTAIRSFCASLNRMSGTKHYSCQSRDGGITVTCHDATKPFEPAKRGPVIRFPEIGEMKVGEFRSYDKADENYLKSFCGRLSRNSIDRYWVCRPDHDGIAVFCLNANVEAPRSSFRSTVYAVENPDFPNVDKELDALKIGEFCVFNIPWKEFSIVKGICRSRSRNLDLRYTCKEVTEGLRVTRLPATYEERLAYADMRNANKTARESKWGLSRLESELKLTFHDLEHEDQHRLRLSCAQKSLRTGWKIKCSIDRATKTATVTRCS